MTASDTREIVAFAMWKHEALRAAPNVGRKRTAEDFAGASDAERSKWLGLADAAIAAAQPSPDVAALVEAISPLVAIADAFDANELDDEARKFWGQHSVNTTPHENIVLYSGRGGKEMLTLADCMKARATLARVKGGAA